MSRAAVACALAASLLPVGVLASPPGPAGPEAPAFFAVEHRLVEPAGPWAAWLDEVRTAALGAPEVPWPRPSPAVHSPGVRGQAAVFFFLTLNHGAEDFHGVVRVEVPELGQADSKDVDIAGSALGLLVTSVIVPLPADAPGEVTLRVSFASGQQVVGERLDQAIEVHDRAPCEESPRAYATAGQKRVWLPWDPPYYSISVCNATPDPHTAVLAWRDRATGRPLALDATSVMGWSLDPEALGQGPPGPGWLQLAAWPLAATVPAAMWVGAVLLVERSVAPLDLAPEVTLVWDTGEVHEVRGDPVTFAGLATPRPPPLPPV